MMCSMGLAPSTLVVLPINRVLGATPFACITDSVPFMNVPPFGMCTCPANPVVAAATAAALGVPTPAPCIPATAAPWVPGVPKVLIGSMPAVDSNCRLMCSFGGIITVVSPGQCQVLGG